MGSNRLRQIEREMEKLQKNTNAELSFIHVMFSAISFIIKWVILIGVVSFAWKVIMTDIDTDNTIIDMTINDKKIVDIDTTVKPEPIPMD